MAAMFVAMTVALGKCIKGQYFLPQAFRYSAMMRNEVGFPCQTAERAPMWQHVYLSGRIAAYDVYRIEKRIAVFSKKSKVARDHSPCRWHILSIFFARQLGKLRQRGRYKF
jgi:hypothetical protein